MPLFEFDNGRLIPAQFGRSVRDGLTDEILASVREQVLQIVARPLFPITWQDAAPLGSGMDGGTPRLTALDASGQVVSVEVVQRLDSATMIDCLSRLADTASLGWNDLAAAYPGGMQGFRMGWAEFRDQMPPSPAPGPRLVLVAGSIADSVRPALDVLASSGVEVHEIAVRAMSNGRKFIDVQAVGPRLYGHNPNLLLGRTSQTMEIAAMSSAGGSDAGHADSSAEVSLAHNPFEDPFNVSATEEPFNELAADEDGAHKFATDDPAHQDPAMGKPATDDVAMSAQVKDDTRPAETEPVEDLGEQEPVVPVLDETTEGLRVIAQILGQDTPIVWQRSEVERYEAMLNPEGEIRTTQWSTGDPNEAAAMVGGSSQYDGWQVWCLGDNMGPSLREALTEINREIREEYESAGSPRRGRRARG